MTQKFFLTIILTLIFSVSSFSIVSGAVSENSNSKWYPVRVQAKVDSNIRLKPAYNAARIGHFKKGEFVVVKGIFGQWCHVEYKNYSNAYVYCPLLTQMELWKQYPMVFHEGINYDIVSIKNKEIVYIDKKGNIIHQAYMFDNGPDYFKEGLSRYVKNEKVGFINEKLEVVIPAQFDFASYFENGVAKICNGCKKVSDGEHSQMEGGTWGTVDKNGVITWDHQ